MKIIGALPIGGIFAVEVVDPVANAVLLVESGASTAHVRNATTIFVTHVKQHTLELLVSIEAQWAVRTVKVQRHIRELLPPFRLLSQNSK